MASSQTRRRRLAQPDRRQPPDPRRRCRPHRRRYPSPPSDPRRSAELLRLGTRYLRDAGEPVPEFDRDAGLLVTGHQPEMFHPGVWVKNFAAQRRGPPVDGLTPVNLVVDTDTMKAARFASSSAAAGGVASVAFDAFRAEEPYETRPSATRRASRTSPDRAAPADGGLAVPRRCCRTCGPTWSRPPAGRRWSASASRPPAGTVERAWGCVNLEVPRESAERGGGVPPLRPARRSPTRPRFRAAYNGAVRAYRTRHGLRSRNHPVPDLAADESPFWAPSGREGRRGPVGRRRLVTPASVRPRR